MSGCSTAQLLHPPLSAPAGCVSEARPITIKSAKVLMAFSSVGQTKHSQTLQQRGDGYHKLCWASAARDSMDNIDGGAYVRRKLLLMERVRGTNFLSNLF